MPKIRFINGTVFRIGDDVGPGDERDATEYEARVFCDGYKDAVRVDGSLPPVTRGMTMRDPEPEHRDPVIQPIKRNR